jgi:N6-adenosine-specific RNA methylase IME4
MRESAMTAPFRRIELDPPWNEQGGGRRGAQNHYPLIKKRADIYQTIVGARFEDGSPAWCPDPDQCHMWMWVTNNFLPDGLWIMGQLGFRYVTNFVWVKTQMGLGQYGRGAHELCLFGTMGATCLPSQHIRTDFGGPIDHERANGKRIHSRKPMAILDQISQAYPEQRALEMFSRSDRPNVVSWGNETNAQHMGQMELT